MNSTVTIERLHCRLFLPAGTDQPAARDWLERIARRDVRPPPAPRLSSLPEEGEAVYRIRRLHLRLHVDLQGMGEDEIARRRHARRGGDPRLCCAALPGTLSASTRRASS